MSKNEYRYRAEDHTKVAEKLLSDGDDALLSAACIELRMALECLAYDVLIRFEDEILQGHMETWQPAKLIKELKEIDPHVDLDVSMAVGMEPSLGEKPEKMTSLGTEYRVSGTWLNKHYNALGSFLHEPTIAQRRDGKVPDPPKIRKKAESTLEEINKVLSSKIWGLNFKQHITAKCECGFEIRRRETMLEKGGDFHCPNCDVVFFAEMDEESKWRFYKRVFNAKCVHCDEVHHFPGHEMKDGNVLTCKCGGQMRLKKSFVLEPVAEES